MAVMLYKPPLILEQFQTAERKFEFSGLDVITIHQDWNSHGVAAVVWEAAITLATYLQTISDSIKNKNVLELGTGTGLTGIVACKMGANVTFTDKYDELDISRKNVRMNLDLKKDNFDIRGLDWKNVTSAEWSAVKYDYIIGADLIYIEELFPYLINVFKYFSEQSNYPHILLSGKIRYQERYNQFLSLLKESFFVKDMEHKNDKMVYILQIEMKK